MQQEATLSLILDTRNESAANGSSFSPFSAFVPSCYTVSLIRTATLSKLASWIVFTPFFPPIKGRTIVSRASPLSPSYQRMTKMLL